MNLASRRRWLQTASCGFGGLAFSGLATWQSLADENKTNPLAPQQPHFLAKAKHVIFLYMHGGTSHVDTFDYKPELAKRHGERLPESIPVRNEFNATSGTIMKSPWRFRPYGNCGLQVSDLFPHVGAQADDLCVIQSMYGSNNAHTPATLELHTGAQSFVRPSVGAWVTYGLGTENQNLPGFITICPPLTYGGRRNFGSAFLSASYQGTMIGTNRIPVAAANINNIEGRLATHQQRQLLDFIQSGNQEHLGYTGDDPNLEAQIASFELAFRMQATAPEVMDLSGESRDTIRLYGIDDKTTENYGRELLLARRFIERGVRFVHVAHTGGRGGRWDQHGELKTKHEKNARSCDKPIAGLLKDLKNRGLLDETLVVWSTEFGRSPEAQGSGRGHHSQGFTYWLAGGGVRSGIQYGATDEFGYHAVERPVSLHDLHATILYLLGLDHTRLTYRYSGRDFRLTDVYGRVLHDIIS